MAQAKKNKGKPKPKTATVTTSTTTFAENRFGPIEHNDGNPSTPAEFDETNPTDEEMYFNAEDGASDAVKNRVKVLNFIHRSLKYVTQRNVPVFDSEEHEAIEIYHRGKHNGESFDVCVLYPKRGGDEFKQCIAIVKLTSADLEADGALDAVVCSDAAWSVEAQKDSFTLVVDGLDCNYCAPRWKYVVKYLCDRMAHDYDKHGNEIRPQVVSDIPRGTNMHGGGEDGASAYDNGDIIQGTTQIFSGATGKVIGTKGAKLYEIKDATGVSEINMPPKVEGGERPRARELVDIILKGTLTQINAAKAMIKAVNDEWANDRPPRRDGGYTVTAPDYSAETNGGDFAMNNGGDSGGVNWADDANQQAGGATAIAVEGDWAVSAGTSGGSGNW